MIVAPILFLIKGISSTTQIVFDTVLHSKPNKIYLAAIIVKNQSNGLIIRNYVNNLAEQITWNCEIKIKAECEEQNIYKLHNETMDWFFKKEEMGIIINSDFLPNKCFFPFCDSLLDHYKNDSRIMYINSLNFNDSFKSGDGSYYFSKYNQTGAWATWKRTWSIIQPNLNNLNRALGLKALDNILSNEEYNYWIKQFQIDLPDITQYYNYKTLLSQWFNNSLAITPNVNLSIQIDEDISETEQSLKLFSQKAILEILDLKHPSFILIDKFSDEKLFRNYYKKSSISNSINSINSIKTKINNIIKNYIIIEKEPIALDSENLACPNK